MCRAIGNAFLAVLSEIGYGLGTLVLNWVCFLEEASSSSFGDKIARVGPRILSLESVAYFGTGERY